MGTFYVNLSGKSIQSATGLKVALKLAAAYTGICKSLLYTLLFRFTVQKYIYPSQCSYSIMTEWAFWKCDARIWTFDLSQEGGANQSTLVDQPVVIYVCIIIVEYIMEYCGCSQWKIMKSGWYSSEHWRWGSWWAIFAHMRRGADKYALSLLLLLLLL